jgi:hypothetical protein
MPRPRLNHQSPISQPFTLSPSTSTLQPAPPPNLPIAPYPQNMAPDFELAALNGPPISLG